MTGSSCTRCECTSLTGEAGARFCARCGHPAADHGDSGPTPAGAAPRRCLRCACPELIGGEEGRFCARCGHHVDSHPVPAGSPVMKPAGGDGARPGGCRRCGCKEFLGEGQHCGRCGHAAAEHGRADTAAEREPARPRLEHHPEPVVTAGAVGWTPQAMTGLAVAIVLALGGLGVLAGAVAWWLTQGGDTASISPPARAGSTPSPGPAHPDLTVVAVVDGNTLAMADHSKVRLAQIDAPGLTACYGPDARLALATLLPAGSVVELGVEPKLAGVDDAHRLVRYVFHNGANINLAMVQRGAAAPYFPGGVKGSYADDLMRLGRSAVSGGSGLWSACPSTRFDPSAPIATGSG